MNATVGEVTSLKGKDCLTLADFTKEEILALLHTAQQLKQNPIAPDLLNHKTLGMIFEKPSTRTRVSFEVGMKQLGGHALFLSKNEMQLNRGETISDTAKVLSRYVDGIMIRAYEHDMVKELAEAADIPVINGLTNDYHPCQALADLLTIQEKLKSFEGKTLAYIGDGNNMVHSLMIGAAKVGLHCTVATPSGDFEPNPEIVAQANEIATSSGATIKVSNDPVQAVKNADIIYTDVWHSMGDEEGEDDKKIFKPYQVNQKLFSLAKESAIFMHCLPAHRNEEVTSDVIDGSHSVVFDQAENRLHAQKALLVAVM